MRYAVMSDIHGNLEALEAVLEDIGKRSIDTIVCLGDVVGYYPDPNACVSLVKQHVTHCIAGNHDYAAIGKVDTRTFTYYAYMAMEWTKKHITAATRKYLESLPLSVNLESMLLTHASPSNREPWTYVFPDSETAVFEAFQSLSAHLNFIGHTHWPSIMLQDNDKILLHSLHTIEVDPDNYYLINVGSVGQPRDFDPRSCYAIYDTDKPEVHLYRVAYDFSTTQKKIIDQNLPIFLAQRLEKGR